METQKLQEIIEQIKSFKQRGLSNLSDNAIMDVSVRIYNSEQIENHRQGKKPFDSSFSSPATNPIPFIPATKEQINYLKKNNISIPIFKKDAWLLIKKHKEKR